MGLSDLTPIKDYLEYAVEIKHTGSRVICDPPVMNTDDDWLFLVDSGVVHKFMEKLEKDGFTIGGSPNYGPTDFQYDLEEYPEPLEAESQKSKYFRAYRKDDLNILITISPDHFENFRKATDLCSYLNLTDKEDRITVFEAVCFDWWPEGRKPKADEWDRTYIIEPGALNHNIGAMWPDEPAPPPVLQQPPNVLPSIPTVFHDNNTTVLNTDGWATHVVDGWVTHVLMGTAPAEAAD